MTTPIEPLSEIRLVGIFQDALPFLAMTAPFQRSRFTALARRNLRM